MLNKRAIVLAADSAGTVTGWHNGEKEVRFFKGENKIFQLSYNQPVGLMTYDNADIEGNPWDLIIKQFRLEFSSVKFPTLKDYATKLFDFVGSNYDFFPADQRTSALEARMKAAYGNLVVTARNELDDSAPINEKIAKINELASKLLLSVQDRPIPAIFDQDSVDMLARENSQPIKESLDKLNILDSEQRGRIIEASARVLVHNYKMYFDHTGIVIGGFGAGEMYPSVAHYHVYNVMNNKLVVEVESEESIGKEKSSIIQSYASSDMTETFSSGASLDLYTDISAAFNRHARRLAARLTNVQEGEISEESAKAIGEVAHEFMTEWFQSSLNKNYFPFRRVVGMLPVDEMAHLCETLINLESLKERVTRPTESVGGPVDVAAITKHEGFIWIKRKHYFDLNKNPRYWQRLEASRAERADADRD